MILYLDTSALVKKYFKETGSDEVISKWQEATGIITSSVAYAESLASIPEEFLFACYDKRLLQAAKMAGLPTSPIIADI